MRRAKKKPSRRIGPRRRRRLEELVANHAAWMAMSTGTLSVCPCDLCSMAFRLMGVPAAG